MLLTSRRSNANTNALAASLRIASPRLSIDRSKTRFVYADEGRRSVNKQKRARFLIAFIAAFAFLSFKNLLSASAHQRQQPTIIR